MEKFLPHYLNYDTHLPKELHYQFGVFFGIFQYTFDWKQITYKAVDLDIQDVDISLKEFDKKMWVSVKMPALKHWEVDVV